LQINLDFEHVSELLNNTLQGWVEAAIVGTPNFVVAVLAIIIFIIFAKLTRGIVRRFLPKTSANESVVSIISTIIYLVILFIGLFVALGILNLDKTVTSLLAGAGVLGIALGFAFQEIAANFVSGLVIAFREPYRIGDIIEIQSYKGRVERINLRTTVITTFDGLNVFVPNKTMFTEPLINYTLTSKRRVELRVGVSYGDDLEQAESLIKEACADAPGRLNDKNIDVYYEKFGDSSINLIVFIWIEYPGDEYYLRARHYAIVQIKRIFEENKITIPFPIRTLDFGIKGGESLTTQLTEKLGNKESE
jgi:small conductance mechanosensitive channel